MEIRWNENHIMGVEELDALILSTLELFSANFWRTLAGRFISDSTGMKYQESHFLTQQQLAQQFTKHRPTLSVLFSPDQGSFFVSSDDKQIFK